MAFAISGPAGPVRFSATIQPIEFVASDNSGPVQWETDCGAMDPDLGDSSFLQPLNESRTVTVTAWDTGADPWTSATATIEVQATLPVVCDWGVQSDINAGFELSEAEKGAPKFRELDRTAEWPFTFRVRTYRDYAAARDFLLAHETLPFWVEDPSTGELRRIYRVSALRRVPNRTNLLEYSFQGKDYEYVPPANLADIGPWAESIVTPDDVQSLVWLDAKSLLEGGTADLADVTDWPDSLAGGTATALQANPVFAPKFHANGGDPFVRFLNTGSGFSNMVLSLPETSDGNFTVYAIVKKSNPASLSPGYIASFPNYTDFALGTNAGMLTATRGSAGFPTGIAPAAGFELITWVFDASGSTDLGPGVHVFSRGRHSFRSQNLNSNTWTANTWSTGFLGTGNGHDNFPFLGDYKCLVVVNDLLLPDSDTGQRLESFLRARHLAHRQSLSIERTIVWDGDSLTSGLLGTDGTKSYTEIVLLALSKRAQAFNLGVSGQTLTQILADAATQVDPLFTSGDANLYSLWAGTNDMGGTPGNPVTPYNKLKAICAGRKAAKPGLPIVIVDCLPRGTTSQFETDRTAFNGSLLGDFSVATDNPLIWLPGPGGTYGDVFLHVGGAASIGLPGSQNNTDLFSPDKIHLTEAGYAIVAALLIEALAAVGVS